MHIAAAPTRPSSKCDPSVHHNQIVAPTFTSVSLAHCCAVLLAMLLSSSIMVLTTGSWPGAGQLMPSVVQRCTCSVSTTQHFGVPDEGCLRSYFSLLLYAFASLVANLCSLESKITGAGEGPDSLISAPIGDVGSAPRTDLACRLRRSWRSSCLPTSLGSHQSSLPCSATAWTQATWTALAGLWLCDVYFKSWPIGGPKPGNRQRDNGKILPYNLDKRYVGIALYHSI
jgi:hypothetical protein